MPKTEKKSERLTIILAEYTALRSEITMKLQGVYQIYTLYFAALSIFYGYIFVKNEATAPFYEFILVIPLVALALFLRLLYDQLIIRNIDSYIDELSEKTIPAMLGEKTNLPKVLQWLKFYGYKIPPFYKWSYLIIFPVLSVSLPLWFNAIALGQHSVEGTCLYNFAKSFPIITISWIPSSSCFLFFSLLINFSIGVFMTWKIIREKF